MKSRLLFLLLVLPGIAFASIYSYPNTKRPAISLKEACLIAEAMLHARGDGGRYFITEVALCGDKEQSGVGTWNLKHYDRRGNSVNAYVPFPTGKCGLLYYSRNYRTKGGEREVEFVRDGLKVKPLR